MTPLELIAYMAGTLMVYHYAVVKGLIPGAASGLLNLIKGKGGKPPTPPPAAPATGGLSNILGGALAPLEDPITAAVVQALHLKVGGIASTLIHGYLEHVLGSPTVVQNQPGGGLKPGNGVAAGS